MIPPLTASGALPSFMGPSPTDRAASSPYQVTMVELVRRFATSPERAQILEGLLNYRDAHRSIGVNSGYQWIDGSLVEDVETTRGRPPGDVDLVTVAYRPTIDDAAWRALIAGNLHLFDPAVSKAQFNCDAYYIDMNK